MGRDLRQLAPIHSLEPPGFRSMAKQKRYIVTSKSCPSIKQGSTKEDIVSSHVSSQPSRSQDSANRPQKRARLTRTNLKKHTRQSMPRSRKTPSGTSSSKVTTIDKELGRALLDNNIVPSDDLRSKPPTDIDDFRQYLERRRHSQSPDLDTFDYHRDIVADAINESSVVGMTRADLLKTPRTPGYMHFQDLAWTEVENELTRGLSDAKPDFFACYKIKHYPTDAREELEGELKPSTYTYAMPSFCMEFKGSGGDMTIANQQAAYDGALMVHSANVAAESMHQSPTESRGKTRAITAIYNGKDLTINAHHAIRARYDTFHTGSATEHLEYHQTEAAHYRPSTSLDEFKAAYRGIRNAQDYGEALATQRKNDLVVWYHPDNTLRKQPTPELGPASTSASAAAQVQARNVMGPPPRRTGSSPSSSRGRRKT